jgi:hypothetical protein
MPKIVRRESVSKRLKGAPSSPKGVPSRKYNRLALIGAGDASCQVAHRNAGTLRKTLARDERFRKPVFKLNESAATMAASPGNP